MEDNIFLDTAFVIALSSSSDEFHSRAVELSCQIEKNSIRMVTTQAILLEIGNALSKERYRSAAVKILRSLEQDQNVKIVSLNDELYSRAFKLFCDRSDKEWGLVDCISFIVMQEHNITDALTTDRHFKQMGFRALLRE